MSLLCSTAQPGVVMANPGVTQHGQHAESDDRNWIDRELDEGAFQDVRLARRPQALLGQFARAPGQSIALVCQDWANIKAACRFLSNDRVSEADFAVPAMTELVGNRSDGRAAARVALGDGCAARSDRPLAAGLRRSPQSLRSRTIG